MISTLRRGLTFSPVPPLNPNEGPSEKLDRRARLKSLQFPPPPPPIHSDPANESPSQAEHLHECWRLNDLEIPPPPSRVRIGKFHSAVDTIFCSTSDEAVARNGGVPRDVQVGTLDVVENL